MSDDPFYSPFLAEVNIARELVMLCREEFEEGFKEGFIETFKETYEKNVLTSVATAMLMNGEPLAKIKMYSRLTEPEILTIADSLGVTVH